MFELADPGSRSNLINMDYHQSVSERHTNLVFKFEHFKDLNNMDPFNIIGVDEGEKNRE